MIYAVAVPLVVVIEWVRALLAGVGEFVWWLVAQPDDAADL